MIVLLDECQVLMFCRTTGSTGSTGTSGTSGTSGRATIAQEPLKASAPNPFPHCTRYGVSKAKMKHEGREEHKGLTSNCDSIASVFDFGDGEVNEQPCLYVGEFHGRQQLDSVYLTNLSTLFSSSINSSSRDDRTPSFVLFMSYVVTKSRLHANQLWNARRGRRQTN
jgi:hypothetical protein